MCGVIGYIGNKESVPILIDGLSKLEYRGYDSAGIAIFEDDNINIIKAKGRLANLEKILENKKFTSTVGIGHTRWATHGKPSDINSHPHFSTNKDIAVIHNGIIENYIDIKRELQEMGYEFISDTDTETIAHLISFYKSEGNDLIDAVKKTINRIEGSYALCILSKDEPDKIIATRKDSPLIIGLSENEKFIASDVPAILNRTREVIFLDEEEIAIITSKTVDVFDKNNNSIEKEIKKIDWDMTSAEKNGYDYFMLKEIFEQPKVVKNMISGKLGDNGISLDSLNLSKDVLQEINKIYIVACGTAYYAGLVGKYLIERLTRLSINSDVASEFRYNNPVIDNKTLVIVVSQSGETADTLAALRLAKSKGSKVLAIVNVVGSSIAREADYVLYTTAGPEIAVASTKAFTAQLIALYLLAYHIGIELDKVSKEEYLEFKNEILHLPELIDVTLNNIFKVEKFSKQFVTSKNVFYIGRGIDYIIAMEGSLKLKEIAYLHSEPYAAGELKHGPIALIEESTLVVGIITQEQLFDKTVSNLRECKARGGKILAIAIEGNENIEEVADHVFYIPRTKLEIAPVLANIFQQLFAYYMAINLGNDVDKPRNLAKSVTVE